MTLQEALPFLGLKLVITKGGWVTSSGLQLVICKNQKRALRNYPQLQSCGCLAWLLHAPDICACV